MHVVYGVQIGILGAIGIGHCRTGPDPGSGSETAAPWPDSSSPEIRDAPCARPGQRSNGETIEERVNLVTPIPTTPDARRQNATRCAVNIRSRAARIVSCDGISGCCTCSTEVLGEIFPVRAHRHLLERQPAINGSAWCRATQCARACSLAMMGSKRLSSSIT